MSRLAYYIKKFSSLRVDRSKGSPAPHKAILLLAIIDCFQHGEIQENKVFITPELVARFKDHWHHLVSSNRFTSNFALPFYHLKSDGFWFFTTYTGREIMLTSSHSIKSFAQLKEAIEYAYFSKDLFELLNSEEHRRFLKQTLIATYFASIMMEDASSSDTIEQVKQQILNEDPALYKAKVETFDEEEKFIRKGFFKKLIPKVYNFTCAITGMRLIANREVQMIDACHIVPFSYSQDDTVSNGISLCPNMHRAFDRGLIAIDNDFRVITSSGFFESNSDYTIKSYDGKVLILPEKEKYQPSRSNLEWHRINVFRV